MSILVTGGAGYIGSHAVLRLLERGERVVVLDDLSTGVRALVQPGASLIEGDVGDRELVAALLKREGVDSILHFAGSTIVPESVEQPLKYYDNNTARSRTLIAAAAAAGVRAFIFSSTAAVYGAPDEYMVSEAVAPAPISPYGRSKLITEWMLADAGRAHGLAHTSLRYFNVAGADPQGRAGQAAPGATHLIKVACEVAAGKRRHLQIFGTDYATPDGTCVRDFIHVCDLIEAHILALDALRAGGPNGIFNCGYGRGYSVRDVVRAFERATGRVLPAVDAPRRPGDIPALIADSRKIQEALGWRPKHDDLDFIVRTALAWERKLA